MRSLSWIIAMEIDLLQLRRPHLTGFPWHGHAYRHQAQVAVDADDPVLPVHPLGGVVGNADDHLQVRYDREGEHDEQQESETPHRLTRQQG
jgi:hypothetical protein